MIIVTHIGPLSGETSSTRGWRLGGPYPEVPWVQDGGQGCPFPCCSCKHHFPRWSVPFYKNKNLKNKIISEFYQGVISSVPLIHFT